MREKGTARSALFTALLVVALLTSSAGTALAAGGVERVDVLIGFRQTPGPSEQALVRGLGGQINYSYHLIPGIAASLPEAAIAALQRNPNVTAVEPDLEVQAVDAELDNAWGVKRIGAGAVQAAGNTGAGVRVAVIDSGIDYKHPELATNYKGGYDFVNDDDDPMDDNGHGTHVAGIIAAADDGAGVVGVAPEAELYALKVLGADGSGSFSAVIAALEWAVDQHMQVTNNSYGSSRDPGTLVHQAFDNADAAGIVNVAAAGNSGKRTGTGDNVIYPAKYASAIAVAATDSSDVRATWSSTGPAVELAAPGVNIYSTRLGGGYVLMSGTSMASPHAAGAAALVIAAGARSNDEVRATLTGTAIDLGATGRDTWYGYGLIDVAAAVAPVAPPAPEVKVVLTTGKATYVSGTDTVAQLTAVVTDELGRPISELSSGAFATTVDGAPAQVTFSGGTDGLYTGSLPLAGLDAGSHPVTVQVTRDGVSGMGSTSFTITVPGGGATTVSVSSVDYATIGGDRHLNVTPTLIDNLGSPVAGASVEADLYLEGSKVGSYTGTTDSLGQWTFGLKHAPNGKYTTLVTGVSAAGLSWDGITPDNGFTKE